VTKIIHESSPLKKNLALDTDYLDQIDNLNIQINSLKQKIEELKKQHEDNLFDKNEEIAHV
jgi:regulator of replication initiation timing